MMYSELTCSSEILFLRVVVLAIDVDVDKHENAHKNQQDPHNE